MELVRGLEIQENFTLEVEMEEGLHKIPVINTQGADGKSVRIDEVMLCNKYLHVPVAL